MCVKKYNVPMSNLPGSLESKKTDILKFKTHLLSRLTLWDGFHFFMFCSKSVDGLTFLKSEYY